MALSRVESPEGLVLGAFTPETIYASPKVIFEMKRMRTEAKQFKSIENDISKAAKPGSSKNSFKNGIINFACGCLSHNHKFREIQTIDNDKVFCDGPNCGI